MLTRIGEKISDRKQEFRALLSSAHGATRSTMIVQLETPIYLLYNYAEIASRYPFVEEMPDLPVPTRTGLITTRSEVVRQPAGVCGLIPTWNFPLFVTINKIAPALATGCTMVIKPSPWGPAIDLLLAEVLAECDLPPGVVNVVTGQAPALGEALVASPDVDRISFTGSVPTGKAIMRSCADTLKRVHLELGGKSALIVLDDADLETAAAACAMPATFHAGQGCAMTTRILVPRDRHDDLVDAVVAHVEGEVRIGDPADRETTLGPVIRPERLEAIEAMVAAGVEQGARLATGGRRPAQPEKGWFFEPTVFAGVDNALPIARDEIFGPVVCVLPYEGDDEAVRIANDSSMGLFGGILSPDVERAKGLARRLRTGAWPSTRA